MKTKYRFSSLFRALRAIAPAAGLALSLSAADAQTGIDPSLRYDQNTYLAAHNCYANQDNGYLIVTADQAYSVTRQLNDGARCLLPDIYLARQHRNGLNMVAEFYDGSDTTVKDQAFKNDPLEVVLAHNPSSSHYWLLAPGIPYQPFQSELTEIKTWMDAHPTEVVTLILESYVHRPDAIMQTLAGAQVTDRVFYPDRPNAGFPAPDGSDWDVRHWGWPTLNKLVQYHRNLVIFSSAGRDNDTFAYQWDSMTENVYGDSSVAPLTANSPRTESSHLFDVTRPLFFMNYFPTFNSVSPNWSLPTNLSLGLINYADLNDSGNISALAQLNAGAAQRFPNFIAVNFVEWGRHNDPFANGPLESAFRSNQFYHLLPRATATMTPNRAANAAGWYNTNVMVSFSGSGTGPNGALHLRHVILRTGTGNAVSGNIYNGMYTAMFKQGIWSGVAEVIMDGPVLTDVLLRMSPAQIRSDAVGYSFKIDTTPPTLAMSITPAANAVGWRNTPVTVKLAGADALSGLKQFLYAPDGLPKQILPKNTAGTGGSFVLSKDGMYKGKVYSQDIADNLSDPQELLVRIDLTAPVTTASVSGSGVTLTAKDNLSGIARTRYALDLSAYQDYTGPITVPAGTHTISFYSIDVAGNTEKVHSVKTH